MRDAASLLEIYIDSCDLHIDPHGRATLTQVWSGANPSTGTTNGRSTNRLGDMAATS